MTRQRCVKARAGRLNSLTNRAHPRVASLPSYFPAFSLDDHSYLKLPSSKTTNRRSSLIGLGFNPGVRRTPTIRLFLFHFIGKSPILVQWLAAPSGSCAHPRRISFLGTTSVKKAGWMAGDRITVSRALANLWRMLTIWNVQLISVLALRMWIL